MAAPARNDDQVRALVDAQGLIQARLADHAVRQAVQALDGFHGWYNTAASERLAKEIAGAVQSAQRVLAQTTDAYVTRVSGLVTGRTIRAAGAVDVTRLRHGTTAERAYARLAKNYRYLVSRQHAPDKARASVVARATAMVNTDVQLAQRAQAQRTFQAQGVTGFRRVLHPELARHGSCGLCIVAADRLYATNRLLPIHDGCHCGVLPVTDAWDPGLNLNQEDLAAIYAAAGGTGRDALKRVKISVHNHGELGPILTNSRFDWRAPDDVAA